MKHYIHNWWQIASLFLLSSLIALLTSCGGGNSGTNTSTTTEIINGISVPLEPDAIKNISTVSGIDSNDNGVRDDVERIIAKKSETKEIYAAQMIFAKSLESDLVNNKIVSDSDYNSAVCLIFKSRSSVHVDTLIINSLQREKADSVRKIYRETPDCR